MPILNVLLKYMANKKHNFLLDKLFFLLLLCVNFTLFTSIYLNTNTTPVQCLSTLLEKLLKLMKEKFLIQYF